jgi:hypothetical protein
MTPEERERMLELNAQIATEQDRERFIQLVKELNELLEEKQRESECRPRFKRADHNWALMGVP